MGTEHGHPPGGAPGVALVERFHPTSGRPSGILSAAVLVVAAVATALGGESVAAAATATGLLLGALVMHVALIRPTMHAYEDHLRLRNMVSDTEVPWHLVDGVEVRQTTRVHVDDEVHHAIGVGRRLRQMLRGGQREQMDRLPGVLGMSGMDGSRATLEDAPAASDSYPDYVQARLLDLVRQQSAASQGRAAVRRRWAIAEVVALTVLSVVFVVLGSLAWLR